MIHPFTLACALLAVGAGAWVYQSKHQAQMLDRDIARTLKVADDARNRAGMLRAEYALLNDPSRLQELADQHLALKTTAPGQFTKLADLTARLPAVGQAKLPDPEPLALIAANRPVAGPATSPVGSPAPPMVAAPAAVAVANAAPQPPRRPPAIPVQPPAPILTAANVATAALPARPLPRVPNPAPYPYQAAAVYQGAAAYQGPAGYQPNGGNQGAGTYRAAATQAVARYSRGNAFDPAAPVVASALGMARQYTQPPPSGSGNDLLGGGRN